MIKEETLIEVDNGIEPIKVSFRYMLHFLVARGKLSIERDSCSGDFTTTLETGLGPFQSKFGNLKSSDQHIVPGMVRCLLDLMEQTKEIE